MRNALVSDFDGTITKTDFYLLVAERYMPPGTPDYLQLYRAGRISHFDAMSGYFSHTPDDNAALETLLSDVQLDPDFAASVRQLEQAGWDLIIVSAGSHWYIDRILVKAGVNVSVHANPGRIQQGSGLLLSKHDRAHPFFSEEVGVDKAAVVRDALSRYRRVAFAGDGPPDIAPSLLVDSNLRFAKSYLADELSRRNLPFRRFERWSEIAASLAVT